MSDTRGRFVWYELMTPDVEAAKGFYGEVIGYRTMPFEGAEKPYTMWAIGEQPIGGVRELPDEAKKMGLEKEMDHRFMYFI